MFLKQTPTSKGIFLQIVESYYDNGASRKRVIEKIRSLDQLTLFMIILYFFQR